MEILTGSAGMGRAMQMSTATALATERANGNEHKHADGTLEWLCVDEADEKYIGRSTLMGTGLATRRDGGMHMVREGNDSSSRWKGKGREGELATLW